jgi:plasmid stabilization system protein ParE
MTAWRIHPAAEQELEDAVDYYLGIDAGLAYSFDEHYRQYREQICQNPFLYNVRWKEVRRVNLTPRFGEYYIAYMVWRERVVILAVAHAKRRPYYWSQRIEDAKRLF